VTAGKRGGGPAVAGGTAATCNPAIESGLSRRQSMKAVIYPRPGPPDVLELVEVPTPVPKDSEMLIRV
jgi:hypothetical protein